MRSRSVSLGLALAVTAALAPTVAHAADRPAPADIRVEVAGTGMQVAIDPQTGRLRPTTAAEARQLLRALQTQMQAAPRRATAATQHADGTLSVVLGEDSLQMFLAKVGADGALVRACVDSIEAAEQFLMTPAATLEEK